MFSRFFTVVVTGAALFIAGCGTETKTTETKKVESPSGTTKITTEQKVETTGTNPPAARP
jgi:hypothetical protein